MILRPGASAICTKSVKNLDAHLCNLPIDKIKNFCYNSITVKGREIKVLPTRFSLLWIRGNEINFQKNFENPLDKSNKVWYNKDTERGQENKLQKNLKKLKKGLDKLHKVWYNKYSQEGNTKAP